jgi:death on curing protein
MVIPAVADLMKWHREAIEECGGGSHGVRDRGLLEAAIGRISSGWGEEEFYPTLFDKAAALLESIIQNHPFIDGNKRTALIAAGGFLERNGWILLYDVADVVSFALGVANKQIAMPEIVAWLRAHSQPYAPEP